MKRIMINTTLTSQLKAEIQRVLGTKEIVFYRYPANPISTSLISMVTKNHDFVILDDLPSDTLIQIGRFHRMYCLPDQEYWTSKVMIVAVRGDQYKLVGADGNLIDTF